MKETGFSLRKITLHPFNIFGNWVRKTDIPENVIVVITRKMELLRNGIPGKRDIQGNGTLDISR